MQIDPQAVQDGYNVASAVVVLAAYIATKTPTQVDNKYASKARAVLNFSLRVLNTLGFNVGRARNADDPKQ